MQSFDEKIKFTKTEDAEAWSNAYLNIAGAISGKRLTAIYKAGEKFDFAAVEVLSSFSINATPADIRFSSESTEQSLDYWFASRKIMWREVELTEGWHKNAFGSMIATLKEDGSPVALIAKRRGGYYYFEPETEQRIDITGKNEDLFDAEAICFYRPLPAGKLKASDLMDYFRVNLSKTDILYVVICTICATMIGIVTSSLTYLLYGPVVQYSAYHLLVAVSIFLLSLGVCKMLLSVTKTLILKRMNTKGSVNLEAAIMMRLISLPTRFFRNYSSGELVKRLQYIPQMCDALIDKMLQALITVVFSLSYLVQMFYFSPAMFIPAVLTLCFSFGFGLVATVLQLRQARKRMLAESAEYGNTYSIINGIQKIKLAGSQKRAFAKWGKVYASRAALTYNPPLIIKLIPMITLAIPVLGLYFIYLSALASGEQAADLIAFLSAFGMTTAAFNGLITAASSIAMVKPILEMLSPIIEEKPEQSKKGEYVTELDGSIEIQHLTFTYPDGTDKTLDDFSLEIAAGDYVGICGSSGCGKSTLIRLLLGFEIPDSGGIYYSKKDLKSLDLNSLRRHIGVALQDGKLVNGTIRSNIAIAMPNLDDEQIWRAAKIANIEDDIRHMPMGLNTYISDGAATISGGQKQRILIARAIAARPKILIFDEATSALDNITQKNISDELDRLDCTRIVIAHRLSTLQNCRKILVLADGNISESGTFEELMEKEGAFFELVKRQQLE